MIFDYNSDTYKTAYLNWRTNEHEGIYNFIILADGYAKGSFIMLDKCLADNRDRDADVVIFPILFTINQSIELYLKAIQWSLNIISNNPEDFFTGGHDIRQLWQTVKKQVEKTEKDKDKRKQFFALTKGLVNYLDELYSKIDPNGTAKGVKNIDFSRYPMDKYKNSHFYILELDNCTVDLEALENFWKDVSDNLDSIAKYYEEIATFSE